MSAVRGRKLRADVAANLLFAVVKAVALMWLIRVAAVNLSVVDLGIFLLARRFTGTAANLVQGGGSQTLLRYVALYSDNARARRDYALFAVAAWLAVAVAGALLARPLASPLASWLFPGVSALDVALWAVLLVVAMVLDFFVRSVLIAERRLITANLVELMTGSGFLLLAFLARAPAVAQVLRFQALATMALCGLAAVAILGRAPHGQWPERESWREIAGSYARYGVPRGVVTFLDMGLLFVGPWLLRSDAARASHLLIAISVVQLFSAAIGPISQVAMVLTAQLAGRRNETAIKEGVSLLLGAILYTVLPLLAFFAPWMGPLIGLWLGDPGLVAGVRWQVAMLAWGILPFALFQGLKGVIEAYWVQAFNLYTLALSYAVLLLTWWLVPGRFSAEGATLSLVAAFWTAGLATLFWLRPFLPGAAFIAWPRLAVLLAVVAAESLVLSTLGALVGLVAAAAVAALAAVAFVRFLPTPFTTACQGLVWPTRHAL